MLALSYDSGAGNGPYGFGWGVGYPHITRRTDRGLPQYLDNQESDVFILSGAEDLVPVARADGSRFEEVRDGYRITRYRPRIESLFARIERWSNLNDPSDTFWRSISRDNNTTLYGKTAVSRIADPSDPTRIFTWLLSESLDDKGNATVYEYIPEDGSGVDTSLASEPNRTDANRSANRYLKRVRYGNRASKLIQPDLAQMEWHFELVMDYGDHDGEAPGIDPTKSWPVRPDPFSTHRAGFEVRTYRRCQRFLMFHRFQELGPEPKLVRSLALDYDDFAYPQGFGTRDELAHAGSTQIGSFLRRASVTGYGDNGFAKSMPPLELTYSRPQISEDSRAIDETSSANLPGGVDGIRHQWLDLNSEGLSGVLTEQAGAWWYKPNRGQGQLGPQQLVAEKPSIGLETRAQFLDLDGDGRVNLVQLNRPNAGFFERDDQGVWSSFTPFLSQPNIEWDDPNLRLVDLTGDGHADVLITEDDVISWHPSLAEQGFGPRESLRTAADESQGPKLVFHDTTETVFLADMSGDGLTDLVRIRNGEVCYWPNLGYGRFGPKVTMDHAPLFDVPEIFEPRRIRLADIDGSGATDVVYLAGDGVKLYFNRSGNSWTDPYKLADFPPIDNLASVNLVDLLGNGTACLVWSSPLPNEVQSPLRYVDLMGNVKPHLLIGIENNLGARTVIQYTSSTRFYLEDRLAGRPWITRLPFPVHVVERTEVYDDISRNRFVTRFAYHHGYFDCVEREFRGFGMVEQWDTEEFASLNADEQLLPATNIDASSHLPPVLTRTWFHTGIYLGRDRVSNFFAGLHGQTAIGEYYREPGASDEQAKQLLLDDTVIPSGLTVDEEREACRALKGAMLRQEIYALDGTDKQPYPYSVAEQNFTIRLLQVQGGNRHAIFFSHPRESIGYHYERTPADPRIAQSLTLAVDDFGNVLKSADVAYGRRVPDIDLKDADRAKQGDIHITYSETAVTNSVEDIDAYRVPLPCESRSHELAGLTLSAGHNRFTLDDLLAAGTTAVSIGYEQIPTPGILQKRLIEHVRILYRGDNLSVLPPGQVQSLALPFETYKLAFTPDLISTVYGGRVKDAMLTGDGRYVHSEGDSQWWIPSGRVFYSPGPTDDTPTELGNARQHFFLPRRYVDPFGQMSTVAYDAYDLLVTETRDPLQNKVTADEDDYRVLQPRLITDPNGNRAAASFDAMGMVVGTAIMGKTTENLGDSLASFTADLTQSQIDDFYAADNPHTLAGVLLGNATTRIVYDVHRFFNTRSATPSDPTKWEPVFAATIARETHASDLEAGQPSKMQIGFSYSDGYGREIQKKNQAEPGPVFDEGATINPRWVGSGWTIFNNKGKPVRQYEPFFSQLPRGHQFEFGVQVGMSPIICYDPVERVVATLHPNHTWEKVIFDPWRQETWDVSDTTLIADPKTDSDVSDFFRRLPDADCLPTWYSQRQAGALGPEEQAAAAKTAIHAGTPSVAYADSLGRAFLTIAHNKSQHSNEPSPTEEFFTTRVAFNIEGNQREVIDANDRVVMRYDYDMLGHRIHQASMEAGERWALANVAGRPIYAWDSRDHQFRTAYDELHRPTDSFLSEGAGPEKTIGKTVYGESQPNPEAKNQRGKVVEVRDQAGLVITDDYDFKGNPLSSSRQFAKEYKATLDWSSDVPLETDVFSSGASFDALNRPTEQVAPDASRIRHSFNEANLLEHVEANLRGEAAVTTFVTNIDYDSKGRRERIDYGNGVTTTYEYDPLTFRLTHLLTTRNSALFPGDCPQPPPADWPGCSVQNLHYTYDPAGNITRIRDDAQQAIFFRNRRVEPSNDYIYDAVYRLIEASGREHLGLNGAGQQLPPTASSYNDVPRAGLTPLLGEGNAVGVYTERYQYDPVGNFLEFIHRGSDLANPGWTRSYTYNDVSLLEHGKVSNRLTRTAISGNQSLNENYSHDLHGNVTAMPHLQLMQWDFKDELHMTQRQAVNTTDADGFLHQGERTYYVYDAGGQRARKVTESSAGIRKKERFYLGGFEVYREYGGGDTVSLERETLHMIDDKQRIALIEARTQGNDDSPPQLVRYQFGNHLGSASLELDDQAQIISYEEHCPYGSTSYQSGRSALEVAVKRYRYTRMERDEETGLNYHGARYCAAWLGRWANCDPIGLADGVNLYGYVRFNPIVLIDPMGTDGHTPEWHKYVQAARDLQQADARLAAFLKTKEGAAAAAAQARVEAAKVELTKLRGELGKVQNQLAVARRDLAAKTAISKRAIAQATEASITAEKSERSAKRWRVAAIVGTVVAIALSAGTLAYPAFAATATTGTAVGTTTTAGASALSTTLGTAAPRIAQAVGGAGGATLLANEAQEAVPIVGEAAPAIVETGAALPSLVNGSGGKMFGEAIEYLKGMPNAMRVDAFRGFAQQITEVTRGQWSAQEEIFRNATVFAGEGGEALVFDVAGNMFRGNLADKAAFLIGEGGQIEVVFSLLRAKK